MSSSRGNCYLYQLNGSNIIIDMGISCKTIVNKLEELSVNPNEIDAIFITHEHIDHIKGLEVFLKRYDIKVFIREKVYNNLKFTISNCEFINCDSTYINDIEFIDFTTSHDSADSCGFIINYNDIKFVHITDSGYLNVKILESIDNPNYILIESNYDEDMIVSNRSYPIMTKKRIISDRGHLSNTDCNIYLKQIISNNTKAIFFAHLSPNNNLGDIVLNLNKNILVVDKLVLSQTETISYELGE